MPDMLAMLREKYAQITVEIEEYSEAFNCVDNESYKADQLRKEVAFLNEIRTQIERRIEDIVDHLVFVSQDW